MIMIDIASHDGVARELGRPPGAVLVRVVTIDTAHAYRFAHAGNPMSLANA